MMYCKAKETPLYEAARKHPIAAKRFMGWREECILEFLKERRIMENKDRMEKLVVCTINNIEIALSNNKPGEAKVYAEMLVLLRQIQNIPSPNWAQNKDKAYSKSFKKISHNNQRCLK